MGETVDINFSAGGLTPSKATTLSINVIDENGNQLTSTSIAIAADALGKATAIFAAPATELGYYRVQASLPGGASLAGLGTRPAGFISYAVVPDPSKRVNYGDAGSRFGMQGGFNSAQGDVIQYLGVRYLLDGPGWKSLEPSYAGQLATEVNAAAAKGQKFLSSIADNTAPWPTFAVPLVTVTSVPSWAMIAGTGTAAWPDMGILNALGSEGLTTFAGTLAHQVAQSFSGQSQHYYQVTWEPVIPEGFGGTPAQLVDFYKLSYAAIHNADPKAIVMGPTLFPNSETEMQQLLSADLAEYIDAISMHPYVTFPPETNNLVKDIRSNMQMVQAAKGHSVPFVGTEHGYTSGSIGELNEALGNIRSTIIVLGEGFKFDFAFYIADYWNQNPSETQNTYGYYWNLDPKQAFSGDKIGPKPVVPAFAAMTYWLDGTTSSGPLSGLTGTQIGYAFARGSTKILALWDYKATSSSASVAVSATTAQVCSWMGVCHSVSASGGKITVALGAAPLYVITEG